MKNDLVDNGDDDNKVIDFNQVNNMMQSMNNQIDTQIEIEVRKNSKNEDHKNIDA